MADAPRYLGLDLGRFCGYALAEGDRIIRAGVRDFSVKKSQHPGHRLIMLYNFLSSLGRIDEIYYEKIMFTGARKGGGAWGSDHGEFYHQLLGVVYMVAAGFGVPTIGIWPGTLKKSFTGSGVAEKEDMCARAHELGWRGGAIGTAEEHDAADAIALIYTQLKERYRIEARF